MNNRIQNNNNNNRNNNLQRLFVHHCATLIQSNFKGYIQRKRYRQFLPIYRRFKELLLAGFEGWKTRRIMKLQPIKAQLDSINDRTKHKQMNLARIAKRELID